MQTDWRALLRSLPVAGGDPLPFDPASAPAEPLPLFADWLGTAVSAGLPVPHAATLATSGVDGDVSARTLILKDLDEHGWWFASRADGRKGRDLTHHPRAAMVFFWREHGRQVRLAGPVVEAGADAAAADFRERAPHSRAAAALGAQSTPLPSLDDYRTAFSAALAQALAGSAAVPAAWRAYVLQPSHAEFWTTTPAEGQIRLAYERDAVGEPWRRHLLWP